MFWTTTTEGKLVKCAAESQRTLTQSSSLWGLAVLVFWQPVLMTGAGITNLSRSETGLWARWSLPLAQRQEASSVSTESSANMVNFLHFIFHLPFAALLLCHSTVKWPFFIKLCLNLHSMLTLSTNLISWFLCFHVIYNVCLLMSALHSLSNCTLSVVEGLWCFQ